MKAIEVERLTKRYGSARGVEDLSFSIEQGEIFGYLGPNGSGKTTTIRCLMGLLRASGGECRLLGQRVEPGRATQHARVGYLPGEFRIWPGRTARKSLKLLARLGQWRGRVARASRPCVARPSWPRLIESEEQGQDALATEEQGQDALATEEQGQDARATEEQGQDALATDRRQEDLAERLDLDLDRRVGALSKGNRQKVGVVYAFQHQPEVLILDEPTIGLDPLVRQVVLDLIREAAEAGATVLLSSHDLSEVAAVCGRAAILREGRLIELAPISQIVQKGERRLRVWFLKGAKVPAVPAEVPAGIRVVRQNAIWLDLAYHGAADQVLKWLARFDVERIATPDTSLEDAFIQYYRREGSREE